MYTTYSPEGTLNNYANEPEVYYATQPSPEQQRNYLNQGAVAALFVTVLAFLTFAVS